MIVAVVPSTYHLVSIYTRWEREEVLECGIEIEEHQFDEELRAVLADIQEAVERIIDRFTNARLQLRGNKLFGMLEQLLCVVRTCELVVC